MKKRTTIQSYVEIYLFININQLTCMISMSPLTHGKYAQED